MKKFMNLFAGFALAFTLAACGGGGGGTIADIGATPTPTAHPLLSAPPTTTIPVAAQAAVAALRAAPQMSLQAESAPFCGASSYEDAFNQLMGWAEGVPELQAAYFPSHQANQFDAAPFIYRYYPATGVYAGISTASVAWLQECGVYVMGGAEFGNVPLYIGQITRFVTPVAGLHYAEKKVVLWTEGFPFLTEKTPTGYAVTRFTNNTGQTLGSCGAPNKPLPNGDVLFECTVVGGAFQRNIYTGNVVTGSLDSIYTGVLPSDIVFTVVDESSAQPVAGTTSTHADGGWYYADPAARWRYLFQEDAGGAPIAVKEGTFAVDGTIKVVRSYSN